MKSILEIMDDFIEVYPECAVKQTDVRSLEKSRFKLGEDDYLICYDITMKNDKVYKIDIHARVEEDAKD